MKSRGISGFGIIFIIIILLIVGYVGYQIFRIQFTYDAVKSKVEDNVKLGPIRPDTDIISDLLSEIQEAKVIFNPVTDSLFIDRSIQDSFRIYLAYNDSSSIFGIFTYRRHLVVDVIAPIHGAM